MLGKGASTLLLIGLLMAAVWFLFATKTGVQLRHENMRALGNDVRQFIHRVPVSAPAVYLGVYIVVAFTVFLPIWPMQVLAGIGFGLYQGTAICLIGSTIATGIAMVLSRWIAADWFRQRVESKMQRVKKVDEALGHNGLLFVMTVRLIPLLPFGLFSYTLGLSTVSFVDAILGTFLGATPVIALHVGIGGGYRPWQNWRFDLSLTAITLLLMIPVIARYVRPKWFEKIGVE
jgi:uncharacterized membrane protein YdjX (TVP38/TMEM64 family)